MSGSNLKKILPRVLITLLGVTFIGWGLTNLVLGYTGKSATAVITSIRREGGERNEAIRGQYTYITSYTFVLPNGKPVDGYARSIGNSVYLNADGKSKVTVRYFSFYPSINTLEKNTKPGLAQLMLVTIGSFLIVIMKNRVKEVPEKDRQFSGK